MLNEHLLRMTKVPEVVQSLKHRLRLLEEDWSILGPGYLSLIQVRRLTLS